MKEINISKKLFLFRFGLTFLALLALHVLFTIYKQLDQASQIFNELAEAGMIPIGYDEDKPDKQAKYFVLPGYTGSEKHAKKLQKKARMRREQFLQANPQLRSAQTDGRNFRTRQVRESVFSYERQFYEADDRNPPTNFIETDPSFRKQKGRKYHDHEVVKRTRRIKNTDNSNENNSSTKEITLSSHKNNAKIARVIILAYRRSGSSFVGEMFNRNPRVFYLFEPIHPLENIVGRGKFPLLYDTLVHHLWDVIYTCSFDKHPFIAKFLSRSAFRLKSEVLRNSGLCKVNVRPHLTTLECKPLNRTILKRLCGSKDHIVVKSIRTSTRKTFEYFPSSSHSFQLNAIHLVRDPRAIINSRLHIYIGDKLNGSKAQLRHNQNLTNALRRSVRVASANLCSRIGSDLKYGKQAGPKLYMLLRYEDAAIRPLEAYRKISRFAGMEESEVVRDWLKRNTKFASDGDDTYSTSRNSTASVSEWRRKFPFTLVNEVQSQCAEVMKILGYLPVSSEKELMNISGISLLS